MHVTADVVAHVAAQVMEAATNGAPAVVRVARLRAIERRAIERRVVMVPAAHSARAAPQIARSAHARTATEHRTGETLRRAIARQMPATVRPVTAAGNRGLKTESVRLTEVILNVRSVMVSVSRGLKTESVRPTEATPGVPIALSALARMVSASRGRRMVLAQRVPVTVHPTGVIRIVRSVMVSGSPG